MKSYKKIASEQDNRVAKAGGFRVRPNSGAIAGHKGDLGGAELFIETKTRAEVKDHIGIDLKWLTKAAEQAFSMGKPIPILVVAAGDNQDYVVFDYQMAERQMPDLLDKPTDLSLSGRGQYIKIGLDKLDMLLYRSRRQSKHPLVRAQRADVDLGILYLEDFISYWNSRQNEQQLQN